MKLTATPTVIDAPQPGDIVTWDKQPRAVRDRDPSKSGRTITQVVPTDDPKYTRLRDIKTGEWTEFSTESLVDRLNGGTITIENPRELLECIAHYYRDRDQQLVASLIMDALVYAH